MWDPPAYDGGAIITEYEIDMTAPDNMTRTVYKGRETECVVASLLPGRPYLFQVRLLVGLWCAMYQRDRGTRGCLLHWSPKFNNNVFLLVGLTTLGTSVNFDWLVHSFECSNVSTTNVNRDEIQFQNVNESFQYGIPSQWWIKEDTCYTKNEHQLAIWVLYSIFMAKTFLLYIVLFHLHTWEKLMDRRCSCL